MYLETSAYVLKDRITMDATTVRVTNRPKRPRGKKNLTHLQKFRMFLGFGLFKKQ